MVKKTKSAKTQHIPDNIKEEVEAIVKEFNEKVIRDPNCCYLTRYKGSYLYFDKYEYGKCGPICRLKYTGDMQDWEFAIYKYSSDRYDSEDWMFPGSQHTDGTILGALKAGLEAYP